MSVFKALFTEVYQKCFGEIFSEQLTESKARQLSSVIFDSTGLVLGWKSLKNFSVSILTNTGREERPSEASLDTLARYLSGAEKCDEATRKSEKDPFMAWHIYQRNFLQTRNRKKRRGYLPAFFTVMLVLAGLYFLLLISHKQEVYFSDAFHSVSEEELKKKAWEVQDPDQKYWQRRGEEPGSLTLFTLSGDNFVEQKPIRNLLLRALGARCFRADLRLQDFFPAENWQQAGIILLEERNDLTRCLRFTVSYNDFFGGYENTPEIFAQILSQTGGRGTTPVELVHHEIFKNVKGDSALVVKNMKEVTLRLELTGNSYRFYYGAGSQAVFALKEVLNKQIDFKPKYIGLFATCGEKEEEMIMPVKITSFEVRALGCD